MDWNIFIESLSECSRFPRRRAWDPSDRVSLVLSHAIGIMGNDRDRLKALQVLELWAMPSGSAPKFPVYPQFPA